MFIVTKKDKNMVLTIWKNLENLRGNLNLRYNLEEKDLAVCGEKSHFWNKVDPTMKFLSPCIYITQLVLLVICDLHSVLVIGNNISEPEMVKFHKTCNSTLTVAYR